MSPIFYSRALPNFGLSATGVALTSAFNRPPHSRKAPVQPPASAADEHTGKPPPTSQRGWLIYRLC